jgi:hypothetical protein
LRTSALALASANPQAPDEANPTWNAAMHAIPALCTSSVRPLPAWAWTAAGGSLLALADLAFAAMFWSLRSGTPPIRIPQSIAAWVLGAPAAHAGGSATALAGMLLYACVVCAMAAGYARLWQRFAAVRAWGFAGGMVYGCAIYALLFHAVLPAWSAAPPAAGQPWAWVVACLAAYSGIGAGCVAIARGSANDGARAG